MQTSPFGHQFVVGGRESGGYRRQPRGIRSPEAERISGSGRIGSLLRRPEGAWQRERITAKRFPGDPAERRRRAAAGPMTATGRGISSQPGAPCGISWPWVGRLSRQRTRAERTCRVASWREWRNLAGVPSTLQREHAPYATANDTGSAGDPDAAGKRERPRPSLREWCHPSAHPATATPAAPPADNAACRQRPSRSHAPPVPG